METRSLSGTPAPGSAALDAASPGDAPAEGILGNPRPAGAGPDLGAVELVSTTTPAEPSLRLRRVPGTEVHWNAVPGALGYDTYRGSLPPAGLASRGRDVSAYDHECFEAGDALGDGSLQSSDPALPPAGAIGWYYLVVADGPSGGPRPIQSGSSTTLTIQRRSGW